MPADLHKARELFLHAVGKLPVEEWQRYLAQACCGDSELQRQVEHLLRVHRQAGSFLERPAAQLDLEGKWLVGEKPSADGLPSPGAANDTQAKRTHDTQAVPTDLTPGESREYPEIPGYEILGICGHGGMRIPVRLQQKSP